MSVFAFLGYRVRGFRVVELTGLAVLMILAMVVYLAKTNAGGERADIDRIQRQIAEERSQIRLLRAEVAHQERPERLETLSTAYLGLQPIAPKREISPDVLADFVRPAVAPTAKPASNVMPPQTVMTSGVR